MKVKTTLPHYPKFVQVSGLDSYQLNELKCSTPMLHDDASLVYLYCWQNNKKNLLVSKIGERAYVYKTSPIIPGEYSKEIIVTDQALSDIDWSYIAKNVKSKRKTFNFIQPKADKQSINSSCRLLVSNMQSSNFIYNYDVMAHLEMQGSSYSYYRWVQHKFAKTYGDQIVVKIKDLDTTINRDEYYELFEDWYYFNTDGAKVNDNEEFAFNNIWDAGRFSKYGLSCIEVRFDGKLVGFAIVERMDGWLLSHFQKANLNLSFINYFIFHETIKFASDIRSAIVCYTNDMGITGLRQFKTNLKPDLIEPRLRISVFNDQWQNMQ